MIEIANVLGVGVDVLIQRNFDLYRFPSIPMLGRSYQQMSENIRDGVIKVAISCWWATSHRHRCHHRCRHRQLTHQPLEFQ